MTPNCLKQNEALSCRAPEQNTQEAVIARKTNGNIGASQGLCLISDIEHIDFGQFQAWRHFAWTFSSMLKVLLCVLYL